MKIIFIIFITLTSSLFANVLVSPIEAMKENYGANATISKKNVLLSTNTYKSIQKNARVKLNTKIYRVFSASKDQKKIGYGVLINSKVRSKNAVVLYFIANEILQGIEIIAFNEPREYLPTKTWTSQFKGVKTDSPLHLSRNAPSITGATLSARSVIDGSRIAFAIYNELLRVK